MADDAVTALAEAKAAAEDQSILQQLPSWQRKFYHDAAKREIDELAKRGFALTPIQPVQQELRERWAILAAYANRGSREENNSRLPDLRSTVEKAEQHWRIYTEDMRNIYRLVVDAIQHDMAAQGLRVVPGSSAVADVAAERHRQINVEGWSQTHDDQHSPGELARAGAMYALSSLSFLWNDYGPIAEHRIFRDEAMGWPWALEWWKPHSARRNLVKAAALILAEIERLDRAALPTTEPGASDG